jgi:hypothetical protein
LGNKGEGEDEDEDDDDGTLAGKIHITSQRQPASQSAVLFSHTNSAPASSNQPASSIFLSQQISTSHQPPTSRTRLNLKLQLYSFSIYLWISRGL